MKNLEKKIDLLVALALAEDEETRNNIKKAMRSEVAEDKPTNTSTSSVQSKVAHALKELGVPCSLRGYDALMTAICLVVEDLELIHAITTRLYPEVVEKLGGGRTIGRVERAIRHAIETVWDRGDLDVLQEYFGNTTSPNKGKLTNSEFIAALAYRIRDNYEEQ